MYQKCCQNTFPWKSVPLHYSSFLIIGNIDCEHPSHSTQSGLLLGFSWCWNIKSKEMDMISKYSFPRLQIKASFWFSSGVQFLVCFCGCCCFCLETVFVPCYHKLLSLHSPLTSFFSVFTLELHSLLHQVTPYF